MTANEDHFEGSAPGYYNSTDEAAAIVCCSLDGNSCERKRSDVCRSGDGKEDEIKVTWNAAKDHCEANGMRLCATQDELDRCCGTGCWYDYNNVWSNVVLGSSISILIHMWYIDNISRYIIRQLVDL